MKNIAKTLLALMLVLCLLSMFVACGEKEPENNEPDTEQNETPDTTPDDKPDDEPDDEPATPTEDPLTNAGENTESGWSDIK